MKRGCGDVYDVSHESWVRWWLVVENAERKAWWRRIMVLGASETGRGRRGAYLGKISPLRVCTPYVCFDVFMLAIAFFFPFSPSGVQISILRAGNCWSLSNVFGIGLGSRQLW